jgi:mono/diheme cytochrome c family protein
VLVRRTALFFLLLLLAAVGASCAQEEYPVAMWNAQHPAPEAGTEAAPILCSQAQSTSLPARLVAMSANASSSSEVILVSDIFQRFADVCGACHGPSVDPPGQGSFQILTPSDFRTLMSQSVLDHVTHAVCPSNPDATNPYDAMPPCSSPNGASYANRPDSDPVKQLAVVVQQWIAAGSPASFTPSGGGSGSSTNPYALTPTDGNAMTNLGNCIPDHLEFSDSRAVQLDQMFAGLQVIPGGTPAQQIGLPEHLSQTDLFTFESATLAKYGVIAYAPAYPLWSDNAGKLRHVRVPVGQSIQFDPTTQQFHIPPNTRFYKTFMKQIADTDGSYRYRKIETRLIVSRPDVNNADGSATQTALFGTYKWNDDESDAILVETPLRNGLPFSDTLFLYTTDEQLAADIVSGQPTDPESALVAAGAARHYAIPSSQRCIQCHMGSPSQSFVLGFTPLQVQWRATGEGGVIEQSEPHEMSQLQRLVDAGVITGIQSSSDVLPLERSQGSRLPRNDYELVAQGYLLGNCTHCHNPRGYPSVTNPVLKDVLNFLPSANGGIFQFPLERYSPRIGRGITGTTPIPYVTPSLVDQPRGQIGTTSPADIFVRQGSDAPYSVNYAPWRSLIYRNVDAGFTYTDDLAMFPHMPFNTPGYDPRAKRILSDWMVSIPAVRKHPELVEYAYQIDSTSSDNYGSSVVDVEPQPYVEVPAGAPMYDQAVADANARLQILHTGMNPALPLEKSSSFVYSRYADPGDEDDILDPAVGVDPICHPVPTKPASGPQSVYPLPPHPHWVNTDLTDPPGPWQPRQTNWTDVLVEQQIPPPTTGCTSPDGAAQAYADQVAAIQMLPDITLDFIKDFATTEVPFGLWQQKSGCHLSSQPTVQSFTGSSRPNWMDVTNPPATAPVYSQAPGEAIFKMICINCHGPLADASGRFAQNLATMTGGLADVADFRSGLFGPTSAPDMNIQRVFGMLPADASAKWTGATPDDAAARYLAWMALGGTSVNIPVPVLQIVAITKVLDHQRVLDSSQLSANMLSQGKALCTGILGPDGFDQGTFNIGDGHGYLDAVETHLNRSLIWENGDAELWLRMCSIGNPPPVHILQIDPLAFHQIDVTSILDESGKLVVSGANAARKGSLLAQSVYPAGQPIGNERGGTDSSLQPTNEWPWCIDDTGATPSQEQWLASAGGVVCPRAVITASQACDSDSPPASCTSNDDANAWAVRGAVNAGLSVFLYLQSLEKQSSPPPDYNQCELLP